MRVAVLTANLGNFDNPVDPVLQTHSRGWEMDINFHRFTDKDFPPIADLSPRFQYRIPKMFGWQMFPNYDFYIWLDASMSLQNPNSVEWFLDQLGNADMGFFKHPWRKTIKEEVDYIEQKLQENNRYIVPRYKNGLHKEQLALINKEASFKDDILFASNAFIYRNSNNAINSLKEWWFQSTRFFTCDQIVLPFAMHVEEAKVSVLPGNPFKSPYVSLVSPHK